MMENVLHKLLNSCLPREAKAYIRALRLLSKPNPVNAWAYIALRLDYDMTLYGTAYLWLVPSALPDHPIEAWTLSPPKVHANGPTSRFPDGYYAIEGKSSAHIVSFVSANDMIRFTQLGGAQR